MSPQSNGSNFPHSNIPSFGGCHIQLINDTYTTDITVSLIALVLGVIPNITVLLLIITTRELRNTTNLYIFMICMCNILWLTSLVIQVFLAVYRTILFYSHVFLLCNAVVGNFAFSVSVFTMVLLAYERWCAVARRFPSNRTGGGWGVSAVVALAVCHTTALFTMIHTLRNSKYVIVPVYYKILVTYIMPLCIIFLLYIFVATALCRQNSDIKASVQRNGVSRKRFRSACVVISLIVNFAICWLPLNMIEVFLVHGSSSDCFIINVLLYCNALFYFLDTVSDPLLIFLLSSDFRKHLISVIRSLFAKWRNVCAREPINTLT